MDRYEVQQALQSGKSIYNLKLRVAFYARVSTDKDEQLHSLSAQVQYYTAFIQNCENWTYVDGYVDEGLSGTSVSKRESFLRMIDDAKAGHFDFIVTKEISRFSRNTMDSIKYTQELLRYGVGVLFQSDNINTLLPDAELRLTIMSSIAQDEVRKTSERVKFGFKRAIESGIVLGNSKIWGYEKKDGRLVIQEDEAKMVREIFELYGNQYLGVRSISNYLTAHGYRNSNENEFSFSTIKGILINPKYKGFYCGGKTHKYDYRLNDRKHIDQEDWVMYRDEENVPPIVSEELWDKANLILAKRSKLQSAEDKTSYQNKYAYSGKIICNQHKQPYYRSLYRYPSGNKEVWQCQEYAKKGKVGCQSPILYTAELDDVVRQGLEQLSAHKEDITRDLISMYSTISSQSKLHEDMARCKVEMEDISRRKDKLLDLNIAGRINDDEFSQRNQRFNWELDKLLLHKQELEEEELKNRDMMQSVEMLRQVIAKELDFTKGFHISVIDTLLDHVEVFATEEKNLVKLKIFFKVPQEQQEYEILRRRGKTSVCTAQYI